jgi:hypothetical protein
MVQLVPSESSDAVSSSAAGIVPTSAHPLHRCRHRRGPHSPGATRIVRRRHTPSGDLMQASSAGRFAAPQASETG